jgi:hypothetical protein
LIILRFYEVEDRPVILTADGTSAIVYGNGVWRRAPALARKAPLDGHELTLASFQRVFSEVPLPTSADINEKLQVSSA